MLGKLIGGFKFSPDQNAPSMVTGNAPGTPAMNGSTADGASTINVDGWTSGQATLNVGDVITIALDRGVRILKVAGYAERRGSADDARTLYEDLSPPPPPAADPPPAAREAGSGRPTKRDRREIDRLRAEPVPETELELQRQYNVGNYLLSLENAGRVATRVQDIDLYALPADFYKTYAKRMSAVTAAKAKELAEKYLSTKDVAIVVVGDAKQVRASLEKLGKVVLYDTDLNVVK